MIKVYEKKRAIIVRGENAEEEAKRIAEQYGGTITENSKTTGFTIRFPEDKFSEYKKANPKAFEDDYDR